jgi:DNA-directed RNA polymerase subunit RPC12/RpoP
MAETLQFQCVDCGEIAEAKKNPRRCPNCGHSVLRPVEVSGSSAESNEERTESFDVNEELDRLEDLKD